MATTETPLTPAERLAAQNLRLARRHGRTLERLAVAGLILGALWSSVCLASDEVGAGLAAIPIAVAGWALLRALGLILQLHVGRAVIDVADE